MINNDNQKLILRKIDQMCKFKLSNNSEYIFLMVSDVIMVNVYGAI